MTSAAVLLTGGTGGIGTGIKEILQVDGWQVTCPTRDELDLSNPQSIDEYTSRVDGYTPNALVLAAGVNAPCRIDEISFESWSQILMVNLSSVLLMLQHFCPKMKDIGGGRIVVISSSYALVAREGRAAYSASKAGLEALVRSAAIEYAPSNILINIVSPGFVNTELTRRNNSESQLVEIASRIPLGRLASPIEIAEAVRFLISPANTYMTGARLQIDGGFLLC